MSRAARIASGADAFDRCYHDAFGPRWPALRAALLAPGRPALRRNTARVADDDPRWSAHPALAGLADVRHPLAVIADLAVDAFWSLDAASVRAALLLGVGHGDDVLDLCAAPGGKAMVLAAALWPDDSADGDGGGGSLWLNELSAPRRARLRHAVETWIPAAGRDRTRVTGHDGALFGVHQPGRFDRVLLDAPCSSERHVLADAAALAAWTPARPRQLAQRQVALLCAAVDALRPGGVAVYATCALLEAENDGVVERVLRKRRGAVAVEAVDVSAAAMAGAEATRLGARWLPDACGEGPMFAARLRRLPGAP